jgi:hypothetical protein
MQNITKANFYSQKYNIAYIDWKNVYLLPETKLILEIYKGSFYYRVPNKSKRFNKEKVVQSLIKKEIIIKNFCPF